MLYMVFIPYIICPVIFRTYQAYFCLYNIILPQSNFGIQSFQQTSCLQIFILTNQRFHFHSTSSVCMIIKTIEVNNVRSGYDGDKAIEKALNLFIVHQLYIKMNRRNTWGGCSRVLGMFQNINMSITAHSRNNQRSTKHFPNLVSWVLHQKDPNNRISSFYSY